MINEVDWWSGELSKKRFVGAANPAGNESLNEWMSVKRITKLIINEKQSFGEEINNSEIQTLISEIVLISEYYNSTVIRAGI